MNAAVDEMAALYGGERPGFRRDTAVEQLRLPPQSVEAEQAVLGGLMLVPDSLVNVTDLLKPEDFYRRDHQLIYRAILELAEKQSPFDAVTLGEWFEAQGLAEQVAGGSYLTYLASTTPSAANVRAYAKIVHGKSVLRELIEVGTVVVNDGFDPGNREPEDVVASAAARVSALTTRASRDGGLRMIRSALSEAWDDIVARNEGEVDIGLTPPWENVRQKLPGLEDDDLMVVAGRPGMGKSVVAGEFADHAASLGRNVALFTLEMSRKQVTLRLLARRARVSLEHMRKRNGLCQEEWARITQANRELHALSLAIDDTGNMTIGGLKARAARMHAKVPGGLGLIVVDYLQLMEGNGREQNRHEEISKISRGLKLLAKELHCPVIALSQLNRSLETRTDKRPIMADLRESGAIEQDADIIAFVYRDDYYSRGDHTDEGVAEFIIGKQRNGPTGTAYLRHHLESSYFSDYHGPKPRYAKKGGKKDPVDGFDDEAQLPLGGRDRAAGVDR